MYSREQHEMEWKEVQYFNALFSAYDDWDVAYKLYCEVGSPVWARKMIFEQHVTDEIFWSYYPTTSPEQAEHELGATFANYEYTYCIPYLVEVCYKDCDPCECCNLDMWLCQCPKHETELVVDWRKEGF